MKTYSDKSGNKTFTRAAALAQLSSGCDPEQFSDHPNYHVRVAAFKASGGELPEEQSEKTLALFKNYCPNIYDRCVKRIERDRENLKESLKKIEADPSIQERFIPLPIEQFAETYASTNALAREFLTRLDVCWSLIHSK